MKFLSSSTTSSSSSTSSFDANLCNSKSATPGCLVAVLRRFLCSKSLPTHPSDHFNEEFDKHQNLKGEQKIESSATPGIVARLMGLESMPPINTQIPPNSIPRSRSMNSVHCWPELNLIEGQHRRVKSSLSFRETPTFLELENEEFFVLSFETKELRSKARKSEMGFGELKQRRVERCKKEDNKREMVIQKEDKEDQETNKKASMLNRRKSYKHSQKVGNKVSSHILRPTKVSYRNPHVGSAAAVRRSKPINHSEVCDGAKLRRKKKKNHSAEKKVEPQCDSENSSPVSVLDFDELTIDPEVPTSEEDLRLTDSNSRRKLSPELEIYEHQSAYNTNSLIGDDQEAKTIDEKFLGSRKKDSQSENYLDMWGEVCRLAEGDIMEFNWRYRETSKLEDFEDVGTDFGLRILDQLLNELVDQLVGTS